MSARTKGSKKQKVALQFMPICDSTQQCMHACGYNPLLELTVSVSVVLCLSCANALR